MEMLLLISVGAALNAPLCSCSPNEPTDSTIIYEVQGEDWIVETPNLCVDSITPRIYGNLYEETSRKITTVYTWVNELPQFTYDGKGTIDDETPFQRYIRESGVFDGESDVTKNVRYSVVIERNGSINFLHREHGKGDSVFYAKIESVLRNMPHWMPGSHNGKKERVLVQLLIMHPEARRKTTIRFGEPYFMDKNEIRVPTRVEGATNKVSPRITRVKRTLFCPLKVERYR